MEKQYCSNCGTLIPEGASFCPQCGQAVESEQAMEVDNKAELADIVTRIQAGDKASFAKLVDMTSSMVASNIRRYISNNSDLEDVKQEVYIKIYQNLHTLSDPTKAYGWIKTIASNTAINYTQTKYARHEKLASAQEKEDLSENDPIDLEDADRILSSPVEVPEDYIDNRETRRLIREIVGNLPERLLSAVTDFYFNDKSVKDIAASSGRSEAAVKMDLCRARKTLKKDFEELATKQGTKLYAIPAVMFFALVGGTALAPGAEAKAAEAGASQTSSGAGRTAGRTGGNAARGTMSGEDTQSGNVASREAVSEATGNMGNKAASDATKTGRFAGQAAGKAAGRTAGSAAVRGGAKGAGGFAALHTGVKAAIFTGVFVAAVAGTVGTAAVTGHLPVQQEQNQQEMKPAPKDSQEEKPAPKKSKETAPNQQQKQADKSQASQEPEKTPLEKAKEEASKKSAAEAYREFMLADPTISSASDAKYAEVNVAGYSYGPLLLIYRNRYDGAQETAFAAYYYNNGDYGDNTVGQVVRISKEDDSAFSRAILDPEASIIKDSLLGNFPDLNTYANVEGVTSPDYDSSTKELMLYIGDAGITWYKFTATSDGTGCLKLDRAITSHYADGYMFNLWNADGSNQHIQDYSPYTRGEIEPPLQNIPKN